MRLWINLEKSSRELIYIYVSKNIAADALSRLDKNRYPNNTTFYDNNIVEPTLESLCKNIALNKEDILHHTSFKTIMRFREKDKSLVETVKEYPKDYSIK